MYSTLILLHHYSSSISGRFLENQYENMEADCGSDGLQINPSQDPTESYNLSDVCKSLFRTVQEILGEKNLRLDPAVLRETADMYYVYVLSKLHITDDRIGSESNKKLLMVHIKSGRERRKERGWVGKIIRIGSIRFQSFVGKRNW